MAPVSGKCCAGFSLLELVMAMIVVSVAAVTLLGGFGQITTALSTEGNLRGAGEVAQECGEFIIATKRAGVTGYPSVSSTVCDGLPVPAGFNRTVTVNTITPPPGPGGRIECPASAVDCKEVIVNVTSPGTAVAEVRLLLTDY